jgi:hypothetical protein
MNETDAELVEILLADGGETSTKELASTPMSVLIPSTER